MFSMMRTMPQIEQGNSTLETLHPKFLDSMCALPENVIQRMRLAVTRCSIFTLVIVIYNKILRCKTENYLLPA